jgi:hypothetical protein
VSHLPAGVNLGKRKESLSKTKPDKMYQPPKMFNDKAKMNEMNTFYINQNLVANQEYIKTQQNFRKDPKKANRGLNNMMILNNSFNYDH